jgi:serine/threonine-protein kinase
MSEVYRATDTVIGRTVAVKILTDAGCADADAKARFLQEARLAGNIQHDNVVNIYDFGEDDRKRPFMVMEFLRGEDLRHAIRNNRLGDLRSRLGIALQTAKALAYIHSLHIVHRDIKPENIHLMPAGVVKLMDFGIAKTVGLSMTRTGYMVGTPYYMAPEQVLGKPIGTAVDIYAFGILFYELLAGERPLEGDSVERIFYAIVHEPLNLEPLHQGGVPDAVCDFIARCTAKEPAQRPQGFDEVMRRIEGFLAEMDKPAPPRGSEAPTVAMAPPRPAAKPWMAIALGIALIAAIGVVVMLIVARSRPTEAVKEPSAPPPALARVLKSDSGDMLLVPAGPFRYGENKTAGTLHAFYVDKTEVTNAVYQRFCKSTGHCDFESDQPDYPVVNVTIEDAKAFARWALKRLPTAMEWEKAARGVDGRLFPWGNQADSKLANVIDNPALARHDVMPVGKFEGGASPFQALDMVGNVWEFVEATASPDERNARYFAKKMSPPPGPDESWYCIRGLSYSFKLKDGAVWDSSVVPQRWSDPTIGFRCVKDPPSR